MSARSAQRRDLRLLPVAAATWAGAGGAIVYPDAALPLAGTLWAGAVVALLAAWIALRREAGTPIVSALAVVAVAAAVAGAAASAVAVAAPARDAVANLDIDGGRAIAIEADVVGKVEVAPTGFRFDATARRARIGTAERRVAAPVVILAPDRPDGLDLGSRVRVRGTAFPADAGDRAVLVVQATAAEVLAPPAGLLAAAAALRAGLVAAADGLPPPGAGLIPGLAVGDTSAVDIALDGQMTAASLSHLTAVSGANCALVVGIAFGIAALCGARRSVRVVAGLVTLVAFVVLVSPEPSVVRAATMAAVAMLGVLLGRIGVGVSVLSASICVLLVVDPWLAGSLGFALSAVATGSLLLFAGPLADGLARWLPPALALAVAVPLAAQLACGPLLILIEPTVPVYGVLANLLAGPAAPVATVLGLLACLAFPVPVLANGFAALAWLPAAWIAGTARVTSELPVASVAWLDGLPGLLALGGAGAAVGALVTARAGRVRRGAMVALAVTGAVLLTAGPVRSLMERARVPAAWAIAACDVGQGDAVLVRDGGRTMLVDTGPDAALLSACLDRFAVDRIDILVLTHFDLDHRGGVDAVVGRTGVLLHGPPGGPEDAELVARFAAAGALPEQAAAGRGGVLGGCRWTALWPKPRDLVHPPGNDASVVVEVTGCSVPDALFLGDLSAQAQRSLAASGVVSRRFPVVKVAHHGSADQAADLYERLDPQLALVTVGENTFGHPRAEILDVLTGIGATVARTDRSGDVALWQEDGALRLWRSRR